MAGRLSELPDDLLRRILHFAPLKEAASTTALSRRWRATPLWLSSGTVNLETRLQHYHSETGDVGSLLLLCRGDSFEAVGRDAFVTEAVAALNAVDVPVTRLTLRLESDNHKAVDDFLNRDMEEDGVVLSHDRNLVDFLLSHHAASRVEDFRLVFKVRNGGDRIGYMVALDALPLATLRVLELTGCRGLYQMQSAALVLPRLSSLRMRNCSQHLGSLQRVIDLAPMLASIRMHFVYIYTNPPRPGWPKIVRLRCPAATVMVLDRCFWEEKNSYGAYQRVDGVEIDAPRLRRFSFKGQILSLSFRSQPPELEQLDLYNERWANYADLDLATFWRLAGSFSSTKEIRLWVNHLEEVALLTEASRALHLPVFRRLRRLELHGLYWMKGDTAAVTIVNLLRSCPVLGSLWINLTAEHRAPEDAASNKKGPRSRIPQKIMQMPALGPHNSLKCLQSSLVRVGLQIWRDESNYFGPKMVEFFAENAMVLEEMHIDEKLCEHVNHKTERWNSKRRKSGATCFVVLPFKR